MRQPPTTFGRISSCFPVLCARAVRTWNLVHYFLCPCFWQSLFRVSGCCLSVRKLDSSGDDFSSWVQCLVQQWIHVLRQYSGGFGRIYTLSTWWQNRFLKRCFSIRFEWRSVPSRCFGCSLALRGSHLETLDFFLRVSRVVLHDDGWFFFRRSVRHFSASSSELRPCQFILRCCGYTHSLTCH